jgi:F-type H+-transporting ATPase subunit b
MRRFIVGVCCLIPLVLGAQRARAADHAAPAGEKGPPLRLKAEGDFPNGKHDKEYDLSRQPDREQFVQDANEGRIHEVEQVTELEVIPKKWDLGIWSIIVFLVLLAVLTKFAWKPMLEGLNKREANIRGALEQAEKTRRDALELQNQLDAKMRDAGGEIARMMDDARRDATAVKDQMVAEARAQIQQDRDRQLREIDAAKSKAIQEIWQQSVALATMISAKVIRRQLSEEDHRRLLDEALAELKQGGGTVRHA